MSHDGIILYAKLHCVNEKNKGIKPVGKLMLVKLHKDTDKHKKGLMTKSMSLTAHN